MSVVTVDAVNQALATVIDPNTGRDLFSSRSARNVRVDEGHVSLDVELGYPALSQINPIREAVQAAIQKIPGVQGVTPHVYQKIIAIEPMITLGVRENHTLGNGWTVVTDDGKVAAHYENTVAITKDGPVILTQDDNGPWCSMQGGEQ